MLRSYFHHSVLTAGAMASMLVLIPSVQATTGCNAIGWEWEHDDVQGCDLYYPAIQWMYDEGIAEGELKEVSPAGEKRLFYPERPINRAEFTKLVLLSSTKGTEVAPCTSDPFPDVPKDAWFAPYICEAKARGIISGFPDGLFKPALDINYANGAKILVKAFGVETSESDLTAVDGEELWYKRYVLALLRREAVAPTIESFDQRILRGEMAEMIYRLVHNTPSYVLPSPQTDGDPLGMGYNFPYSLEFSLGLWVKAPDEPYFFAPAHTTLFSSFPTVEGYKFFHTLQQLKCTESGMWEHCSPLFIDWSISLYVTDAPLAAAREKIFHGEPTIRYFGGRRGECFVLGVEGENTEFCFVPLANGKTLVAEWDYIDTNVAYMNVPGITPLETSKAWFARIRSSMQFAE